MNRRDISPDKMPEKSPAFRLFGSLIQAGLGEAASLLRKGSFMQSAGRTQNSRGPGLFPERRIHFGARCFIRAMWQITQKRGDWTENSVQSPRFTKVRGLSSPPSIPYALPLQPSTSTILWATMPLMAALAGPKY